MIHYILGKKFQFQRLYFTCENFTQLIVTRKKEKLHIKRITQFLSHISRYL